MDLMVSSLKSAGQLFHKTFMSSVKVFFEWNICMRSINGSYIVLIPKKDTPLCIGDYRSIYLLNSSIKLITKLLSQRLQEIIVYLIHANQYGFIKSRTIYGCLAWAFEYISLCRKTKKEMVIIKLDFEKAFDRVEPQAILQILQHKGFSTKWINWIRDIIGSGTSTILLNGVPEKMFPCRRGVRQGDPLSPLLFVLAADLLQTLINRAKDEGRLKFPIPLNGGGISPLCNMPMTPF